MSVKEEDIKLRDEYRRLTRRLREIVDRRDRLRREHNPAKEGDVVRLPAYNREAIVRLVCPTFDIEPGQKQGLIVSLRLASGAFSAAMLTVSDEWEPIPPSAERP